MEAEEVEAEMKVSKDKATRNPWVMISASSLPIVPSFSDPTIISFLLQAHSECFSFTQSTDQENDTSDDFSWLQTCPQGAALGEALICSVAVGRNVATLRRGNASSGLGPFLLESGGPHSLVIA